MTSILIIIGMTAFTKTTNDPEACADCNDVYLLDVVGRDLKHTADKTDWRTSIMFGRLLFQVSLTEKLAYSVNAIFVIEPLAPMPYISVACKGLYV